MASGGRFALIDDEDNESNPTVLLARAPVKVVPVVEAPKEGETTTQLNITTQLLLCVSISSISPELPITPQS